MSHYFINDPGLGHTMIEIDYCFKDLQYRFVSDSGVFSKNHVDEASDLLIRQIPVLQGRLLDIGCGYGCIGIALGKAYDLDVTLSDVNERALTLAASNAEKNGIKANVICSDCFENIYGEFDTIVTNPPIRAGKQTVFRIYEGALAHLKTNGALYVVIREKHGACSSAKKLAELFGACETLYKKKGCSIFRCTACYQGGLSIDTP